MKWAKYSERTEKRYVVKEAPHGTCKGCDFYRLKPNGAPEYMGMDYACDRDYRDDDKCVVFAELGNARYATDK
jgi:hypothetical protein